MALFLTEGVDSTVAYGTLEEAYDGLLESSLEMHDLTESLLQADFIIHENAQYLTEAEQDAKKSNFLKNAAAKVKTFILAVRDRIVAFFKRIAEYAKKMWNKLTGAENPSKKISLPKGAAAVADQVVGLIEKAKTVISDNKSATFAAAGAAALTAVGVGIAKLKGITGKKDAPQEVVDAGAVAKVFKFVSDSASLAGTGASILQGTANKLDANATGEEVSKGKTLAGMWSKLTGQVGSLSTSLMTKVRAVKGMIPGGKTA